MSSPSIKKAYSTTLMRKLFHHKQKLGKSIYTRQQSGTDPRPFNLANWKVRGKTLKTVFWRYKSEALLINLKTLEIVCEVMIARMVPLSAHLYSWWTLKGLQARDIRLRGFYVWVADLGTRPKNPKFLWLRLENRLFVLLSDIPDMRNKFKRWRRQQ